jgi:hypothetical protein
LVALILDEPAGTARKLVPFAVLSRLLGTLKDGKAPTWSQGIEQSFRIERTITILNLLEWESPDQRALRRSKLQKICYNS